MELLIEYSHREANKACIAAAEAWAKNQSLRHCEKWPWLEAEMRGIARGSGVAFEKIEQLNFRIWQYGFYGAGHACSNFIGETGEGVLLLGGALDDPRELYGFVDVRPDDGYRFMTFPICGTVWGSRGLNEAGLAVGIASQPLNGLRFDGAQLWQQDICLRVLLQTCATCDELLAFCRTHPFSMNCIVADASGSSKAFTSTPLGVFEFDSSVRVLTNHLLPQIHDAHLRNGWDGETLAAGSFARAEQLQGWLCEHDGNFSLEEAKTLLCRQNGNAQESVNNPMTAFITVAMPQRKPHSLWVAQKPVTPDGFREYSFD